MPILEHTWGMSPAQDRVWAMVAGIAPSKANGRLLMVLQAFFDESESEEHFVLAGHVASAEAWASFSKEWEAMLPFAQERQANGNFHVKMSSISQERMERIGPFWKIIEDHVIASISCRIRKRDLINAQSSIYVHGYNYPFKYAGIFDNFFMLAYYGLLDVFHSNKKDFDILADEPVDFIFDDKSEKARVLRVWDQYLGSRPERYRNMYGAVPRFENDQLFLPLQAADVWAWWVRKWSDEGNPGKMLEKDAFGLWERRKKNYILDFVMTEENIVRAIKGTMRQKHGLGIIYDVRFFWEGLRV